jgi:hypothetical protein
MRLPLNLSSCLSPAAENAKGRPDRIELETNRHIDRRHNMADLAVDFETGNEDGFNGEDDRTVHERTHCLESMIAYLLERNEQLRMQLVARRCEENA